MKKSTISLGMSVLLLTAVLGGAALAQPGHVEQSNVNNPVKGLAGSWRVTGQTALQGTFYALITFHADGTVTADEPSAHETAGHGTWVDLGRNEAGYTFVSLFGSPTGAWTGSLKLTGTLHLDFSRGEWIGPFKVVVFDTNGHVIFSDTGTLKGNAIRVEPLN